MNDPFCRSHHATASRFSSSKSANVRPARKFVSMKWNCRSTCALRFASPFSCAAKTNPNRSANANISGEAFISRPVPTATTTCVLSIMQRPHEPPKYFTASVRNCLHSNRVKRGYICAKIIREWQKTRLAVWTRRGFPPITVSCGDVSCCISSPGAKS